MADPLSLNTYIVRKEIISLKPTYDVLDQNGEAIIKTIQKNLITAGVPDFIITDANGNKMARIHHEFSMATDTFEFYDASEKLDGKMHQNFYNKPPAFGGLINPYLLLDANENKIAVAGGKAKLSNLLKNIVGGDTNVNYSIYDPEQKNIIAEINIDLTGTGVKDMFKNLAGRAYLVNIQQKLIPTLKIIEFILAIDIREEYKKWK